ncbi:uncharacterized protein N7477_002646 [Penicillium maclennaniae]|uniref:uncharacterized protein n=1 Tax=Penicillium maclennaniae TaxID=1343394 RepID=UPI002540DC4E|nr:uncharacterized protein N7477_002646 [Penicillium maclennaniae]KAJ5677013.1 hypothetical protein N7477_002646 [Penicillium maclennaniae]
MAPMRSLYLPRHSVPLSIRPVVDLLGRILPMCQHPRRLPNWLLKAGGAPSSRSAGTKRSLDEFELPPPPTRTRKIIQMKPKAPAVSKSPAKPKENGKAAAQTSAENTNASSTKKKPSATSAAGRKIARKTAHSLIERRRRSKMNEEFGTLKDMIPACQGQDMHKLAILQVLYTLHHPHPYIQYKRNQTNLFTLTG